MAQVKAWHENAAPCLGGWACSEAPRRPCWCGQESEPAWEQGAVGRRRAPALQVDAQVDAQVSVPIARARIGGLWMLVNEDGEGACGRVTARADLARLRN